MQSVVIPALGEFLSQSIDGVIFFGFSLSGLFVYFSSAVTEFASRDFFELQCTLSISTTLYLELLYISNKKLGPLDISVIIKLFLSLYLELLYLEFFSISNKILGPLRLFLSISPTFSRLRGHLHSKQDKSMRYYKFRM